MIFDLAVVLSVVEVVGWTLLHFLWQGALIGAIFAAAKMLFEVAKLSANARYLLGLVCLLLLAVAPIITFYYLWSAGWSAGIQTSGATLVLGANPLAASAELAASGWSLTAVVEAALPWLVLAWAAGVLLLSFRVLLSWQRARRMTQDRIAELGQTLQQRTAALIEKFEIKRRVQVFESALVQVPTVIGWLKPVVLLPTSAILGLTPTQLELVIAHELGHVRRFDYLVNLLQVALETLLFYHPAVRWISGDVRVARELCCDDLVVAHCGQVTEYAKALASLELMRGEVVLPGLAATDGPLLKRIERMLKKPSTRSTEVVPVPGHGVALGTLVLVAIAGVQGFNSQSVAAMQALELPAEPLSAPLAEASAKPIESPLPSPLLEMVSDSVEGDAAVLAASQPAPAVREADSVKAQVVAKLVLQEQSKVVSADVALVKPRVVVEAPKPAKQQLVTQPPERQVEELAAVKEPQPAAVSTPAPARATKEVQARAPVAAPSIQPVAPKPTSKVVPKSPIVPATATKEVVSDKNALDQSQIASQTAASEVAEQLDVAQAGQIEQMELAQSASSESELSSAHKPAASNPAQLNPPVAERLELAKIDQPKLETKPVLQPVPVYKEAAQYPDRAQRRGQEGYVLIEYSIKPSGKVGNFKVVESKPRRVFVQAATMALRGWRFDPADGKRFAGKRYQQKFNFYLAPEGAPLDRCVVTTGSRICQRVLTTLK